MAHRTHDTDETRCAAPDCPRRGDILWETDDGERYCLKHAAALVLEFGPDLMAAMNAEAMA